MKNILKPMITTAILATSTLGTTSVFAANANPDPNTAETPVTAELELKDAGPVIPPVDPDNPTNPGENPTPITGHFGIAYVPQPLSANKKLEAVGEQKISLANATGVTKYNVGVRDTLRKKNIWELSAQLTWIGDSASYMNGATITGENGKVTENVNGTLGSIKDGEVVTSASTLDISNTPLKVLETVSGKQTNGIYNYGFENPSIVIPAVEKVPSGSYTGNITWNLTATP